MATREMEKCIAWLRGTLSVPEVDNQENSPLLEAYQRLYHNDAWEAIEVINDEFGTRYEAKRFREWMRRERKIPAQQKEWIRQQIIFSRFDKVTAKMLCRLLDIRLPGEELTITEGPT